MTIADMTKVAIKMNFGTSGAKQPKSWWVAHLLGKPKPQDE